MIEIKGNVWDHYLDYAAICVTTNGVLKIDGSLVMGAGIAKQFASRFPFLPQVLGEHVRKHGNTPVVVSAGKQRSKIVSFPTKFNWRNSSSLVLLLGSAAKIKQEVKEPLRVLSPRPGCGMGGLSWEKQVREPLSKVWDSDRFVVISNT